VIGGGEANGRSELTAWAWVYMAEGGRQGRGEERTLG